jgi:hypothetical protein
MAFHSQTGGNAFVFKIAWVTVLELVSTSHSEHVGRLTRSA